MNLPVDLATASREELLHLIGQLLERIAVLEARIAELEGQQKPPTDALSEQKPPSWVKPNRPARPKKERKKRAHGFARRREEPTHRVEHALAHCPHCQVPLLGGRVSGRRQVLTLPRIRVRVTEHVVLERTCPKCQQRWAPKPDWRAITVGRQRVGISVQSEVSVLREECRLPFGLLQRYLKGRYGLHLSVGELVALVRGVAVRGQGEYAQLQQAIRDSPVVQGDETGWREEGHNGYLWSFSTPRVRYFLYRPSRGGAVVEEVLGEEFDGVLVSDFYGAYNVYQGPHQRCWSHLLRAIHQLKERYPQDLAVSEWAQGVREVYDRAQAYPGPDPSLPGVVQQAQRLKQQRQYQEELWALCQPYLKTAASMRVLCQRVERFLPELFTFTADPQVPADNNGAERSLRPPVVSRKVSGGTRSEQGSETKSILASLFGTWRLQGRDPYQAVRRVLTGAQPAPVWTVTARRRVFSSPLTTWEEKDYCHMGAASIGPKPRRNIGYLVAT
jgi:transposase